MDQYIRMTNVFETLEDGYIRFGRDRIDVIIDDNDDAWFRAKDTMKALGYRDSSDAINRLVRKQDVISFRDIESESKGRGPPLTLYISEGGFYSLTLKSHLPKAKRLASWIVKEVLPSLRKYSSYQLKKRYEREHREITEKLRYLEKQYAKLKNLKRSREGLIYVLDYSDDIENIYRIETTKDMALAKKIHGTGLYNKRDVVLMFKTNDLTRLEACVRAMLYENRHKNGKDFICSVQKIERTIKVCIDRIKHLRSNQKGGFIEDDIDELADRKDWLERKIGKLNAFIRNKRK